ncbi:DNA polymerase III subunit [Marinirhabdus gelatinilytica]|uniref:DNA polymerase-3 subunit delta n=1 Tax=Marinirhabdus gelatinilytica TaxID=1703343 RepID=A0A370QJF5_9FLAO|nr:DNA polymerase III subunit delta' [Marinirhabdus gelatinilytica]RDK88493.1 DNA polymerase-3 subunit delta' [Marinirhabdus gelatinilytica]
MDFSEVVGHKHLKSHLTTSLENGRIPHAQLFVGPLGTGLLPMALAYASEILCEGLKKGSDEEQLSRKRVAQLSHPDLHFVFPVNTNDKVRKHPVSSLFMEEWRQFVQETPYASLFSWLKSLGIENKQGNINVDEAADLLKTLSLKSFEGGFKVVIAWMADNMNTQCANKILKLLEEPPERTVLLLLTEQEEQLIGTIRSRCQILHFPLLSEEDIATYLVEKRGLDAKNALQVSHRAGGDLQRALQLLEEDGEASIFNKWFVTWVRTAFKAKGNKKAIHELLKWSDNLAGVGRETQKKFLGYCIETFRQALLKNYKADSLLFFESSDGSFDISKFAPFVHQNNIFEICEALEDASYHIERNGNAKLIFSDLSIKLTRLIHKKELT